MKNRILITRKSLEESGCTEEEAIAMGAEVVDDHILTDDEPSVLACIYDTDACPPHLADTNEHGPCALCGAGLQYRPGIPAKITRLCISCAVGLQEKDIH